MRLPLGLPLPPLPSASHSLPHSAIGFPVAQEDRQAVEADEDASENQHCSSHRYEWRFCGLCLNGNFEVLEVGNYASQEVVFGLHQLVLGHVVDVGAAAAASQHNGCSSWF